jgi:hypothetical protein
MPLFWLGLLVLGGWALWNGTATHSLPFAPPSPPSPPRPPPGPAPTPSLPNGGGFIIDPSQLDVFINGGANPFQQGGGKAIVQPSAGKVVPLSNPTPVVQGSHYLAKLDLSGVECAGDPSAIAAELAKVGLGNAKVYMSANVVPGYFPDRVDSSGAFGCTRWAEADWTGPSVASISLPVAISAAWVVQ